MRALPVLGLVALCAACAAPPPAPAPAPAADAPAPEAPGIETAAIAPATQAAVPVVAAGPASPPPPDNLPASLSRAQVEKTFGHHRRYFNAAYRERLQARPGLAGTIQVSFTIEPDGSTSGVRQHSSTIGDAPFERAVLDQVDRMSFPPASGRTPVERYPLQFSERTQR